MYMLSPIRQNTLNFLIRNEGDGVWFKVESLRLKAGGEGSKGEVFCSEIYRLLTSLPLSTSYFNVNSFDPIMVPSVKM